MKQSILTDLYFGRISPWERRPAQCEERFTVNRKIENEKRYFVQRMSLDDCQRFQAFENLYLQASGLEELDAFSHGFKLGVTLMCAVFEGGDAPPQVEK